MKKRALKIVFSIGLLGLIFSGVLTYQELFSAKTLSCGALGAPGSIFGYPACVYGFFMYLAIVTVSFIGIFGNKEN